jgi:hypothetical protein
VHRQTIFFALLISAISNTAYPQEQVSSAPTSTPIPEQPKSSRAAVAYLRQEHAASERRACGLIGQPRATQRYQRRPRSDDGLKEEVAKLAAERPRFGYRRLTALLQRAGRRVWHGRVHRITKELRLQVPRRKRKRLLARKPAATMITRPNQRWGMDFVSDALADGRSFRALAIIDHQYAAVPGYRSGSEPSGYTCSACARASGRRTWIAGSDTSR